MNKRAFVRTLLATVALGAWVPTVRADEPVKAVYHFTQGVPLCQNSCRLDRS